MTEENNHLMVALAGNPNSGKTTIFNSMTGGRQHVGNYPGVTVAKREGFFKRGETEVQMVDLPGIYCMTAYSIEEVVSRNFILEEKPDIILNVIDSTCLERSLYLTIQLMELRVPMLIALNMSDIARARGLIFDLEKLSQLMGVRIVTTVGNKQRGINELVSSIFEVAKTGTLPRIEELKYGDQIEDSIARIVPLLDPRPRSHRRWRALKLLENDREILQVIEDAEVLKFVREEQNRLESFFGESPEVAISDRRYGYISGIYHECVQTTTETRHNLADKIDSVLLHPIAGLPIFLGFMYLIFFLTFTLATPFMHGLETFFGWLGTSVGNLWPAGSSDLLRGLIVEGIIGGVGGVISFLPNLMFLFLGIALLEDSGYMSRIAFIMDKLMHKIGLHGQSFIPMLLGFGCSVPAIMATRTIRNRRDRLTTMMVIPLISCGARLPIYAMLIPAFFSQQWQAPVLWLIYIIGVLLAGICALGLRKTIFKGDKDIFVMELPPYRSPTLKGVLMRMWHNGWLYLKKAGTIILGISILLWALSNFPRISQEELDQIPASEQASAELSHSAAGQIGQAIEPLLKPMGFDYRIGTALIGAAAAKEVFVAQMGIIYAADESPKQGQTLREKLRRNYSPLTGFCIMLFTLIGAPCVATLAAIRKESGSWIWALLDYGGLTLLAYILTAICYQLGTLLGIGI